MIRALFIFAAALFLAAAAARADLNVSLTASAQNAGPGLTLIFSGTLTNTSATTPLFLNDVQISGEAAPLSLQSNTFFFNVPGILAPGGVYTGPLFSVTLASNAPSADYPATISFLGGSNVFGATSLASVSITVLSPTVSVSATVADASEYGPASGTIRFSRTGGTGADLAVSYSTSGTATNGVTYLTLPGAVTIPAGSSSAAVSVTPIPDDVAEGDRSAILTIVPSSLFDLGAPASATVTVHDKPADQWRLMVFGAAANTSAASDTGEWHGDGIPNLVEYALNLNPLVSEANALPNAAIIGGCVAVTYTPNPAATDVVYIVEGSTDLVNWSTANVQQIFPSGAPPNSVTYEYSLPISSGPAAFLRLRVNRLSSP